MQEVTRAALDQMHEALAAWRPALGVWACPRHGRLPVGAGFNCPACAAERPRWMPCMVNCWVNGCRMVRGVSFDLMRVRRCELCGDEAYDYDVT